MTMTKEVILSSKFHSQDHLASVCGVRLHSIVIDKLCELAYSNKIINCGNYSLNLKE